MSTLQEEWRPAPGTDGRYSVSSLGRVRRESHADANGRLRPVGIVRGSADTCGYLRIRPYPRPNRTVVSIHRLVALAFLGPCPEGHEVNHIDGDRKNNRADNLEYVTHIENVRHAWRLGNVRRDGEHNGRAKLTADQVRAIRRRLTAGATQAEMCRAFGMSQSQIHAIAARKQWVGVE